MITQFNPQTLLGGYRRSQSHARELLDAKRYAEARTAFAELLKADPGNGDALLGLAEAEIFSDRPQEGLQCLQNLLAIDPRRSAAYSLATVALLDLHAHEKVVEAADVALGLDPNDLRARVNKGTAYYYQGRFDEALVEIGQVLTRNPDYVPALITLGLAENGRGAAPAAAAAFERVLALRPDSYTAHLNLSALETACRRFDLALAHAEGALALRPDSLPARINRSAALLSLGRNQEALEEAKAVLARDANNLQARQHQRMALAGLGRMDEMLRDKAAAIQGEFRDVRELQYWLDELVERGDNDVALATLELGVARFGPLPQLLERKAGLLWSRGEFEEALAASSLILEDDPRSIAARLTGSGCLHQLGRDAEALVWADAACCASEVPSLPALLARATALAMLGRFAEAERDILRARQQHPALFEEFADRDSLRPIPPDRVLRPFATPSEMFILSATTQFQRCDWQRYDDLVGRLRAFLDDGEVGGRPVAIDPYTATLLPFTAQEQLRISRSTSNFIERETAALRARCAFAHPREKVEKLKVGYVSPDFRNHAVYEVTNELYRNHDRRNVEVFAYALYPGGMDAREGVRAGVDHFVELAGLSNEQAARRIRADGIHVLVDMAGYTSNARSEIFALRPAPLQLSYMGFPGTTGAPWLDYIVATKGLIPPALEPLYSERVIRLPGTHMARSAFQEGSAATRAEMGLPQAKVVFACFQDVRKYDPQTYACWMRILRRVDDSVLWLYVDGSRARKNLAQEAARHGVDPKRLIFAEKVHMPQHIARQRLADLFLDTPLYSGITTVAMALWAGLPVLTWPRESYASRMGAAALEALGVTETVVASLQEYEGKAVQLGNDPAALKALRARVESAREGCALFDAEATVRALESAYETIWQRYVDGEAPSALDVQPVSRSATGG